MSVRLPSSNLASSLRSKARRLSRSVSGFLSPLPPPSRQWDAHVRADASRRCEAQSRRKILFRDCRLTIAKCRIFCRNRLNADRKGESRGTISTRSMRSTGGSSISAFGSGPEVGQSNFNRRGRGRERAEVGTPRWLKADPRCRRRRFPEIGFLEWRRTKSRRRNRAARGQRKLAEDSRAGAQWAFFKKE